MSMRGFQVGLDIGTAAVRVVISEPTEEGKLKIIGVGEAPCRGFKGGTLVDIEATAEAIVNAVEKAEEVASVRVQDVHVGLAGEHFVSMNCTGVIGITDTNKRSTESEKEITEADVEQVLESAKALGLPKGWQIIHVIPQKYRVDDQGGIRNPVGMSGRKLEAQIHLVTSTLKNTNNLMNAIKRARCRVREIILEPMAASQIILTDEERQIGVALVDIGAGSTDLVVMKNNTVLHSQSVPVGAGHVTNDISKILKITEDQAEELKLDHGTCDTSEADVEDVFPVRGVGGQPDRNLNEAELAMYIEARVEEILHMVRSGLREHGVQKEVEAGFVFTGGGASMRGLLPLARQIFKAPVRIGKPQGFVDVTERVDRPEFATAAGLVAYASKYADKQLQSFDSGNISGLFDRIRSFFKENF